MINNVTIGVDYYPEHWEKNRWLIDVKLMKDFGIDVVRLAEFSWYKIEPSEGKFNFEWLDEVINLMSENNIKVILGTPTAAPPAWLINKYPEIQPIDSSGRVRHFGGRHHDCQSNETYRKFITKYVTKFARHFGGNSNVIGWQIDNELGNSHDDLCFCNSCKKSFQNWLEIKYGTIENLNDKWGTVFWSQQYQNFEQIQPPKLTVTGKNPSQMLDWKRFHSDLIVEFHHFQSEIIRKYSHNQFITHNMMGFADTVDYFDLGEDLDFAAQDQYSGDEKATPIKNAAKLDLIRGIKNQTFWIMEQQSGIIGWDLLSRSPKPGQLGLWAMQSIAHGADTIVFFRWRSCTVGTEQFWHGLLSHSGEPTRYYYELKKFSKEVKPLLNEIHGITPKSKVGIVFSYNQEYALTIQRHNPNLNYIDNVLSYYQALNRLSVSVDFVSEKNDFEDYDYLIAPLQFIISPDLESKYRKYVKNGGNLILTMRTGVKDEFNRCLDDTSLPGKLSDVLGISVKDYDCLLDDTVKIDFEKKAYTGRKWADIITLEGAEAVAIYKSDFYSGSPCITKNKYGKGMAYYIGTELEDDCVVAFTEKLISERKKFKLIEGVEITQRNGAKKDYYFVLNHTDKNKKIELPPDWISYYKEQNRALIAPFSYQVYYKE